MDIEIQGYTLLRTLGKGGMATVFLAKQDVLERKVALKIMAPGLADDPAFGQRFLREARIVSQLVHPNIVTVHEVGQQEGHYYLSMEYIDGHDLHSVRRKLAIVDMIRVVEDIARALHYAGDKGYVHRDIKPENIMFRSADGSAVLTDFGIAKAVKNDLAVTQTGTAIGTPHYMSPEQAKGKDVDHRSDLYSLGIVFFWMLTGRVPYDSDTAVSIGIQHITEPLPELPRELSALQPILDGLLAKDPALRYQNGLALLNDLRAINLHELQGLDIVGFATATSPSSAEGVAEDESESSRFTLEFESSEDSEPVSGSVWPTVWASIFVVLALCLLLYLARPALLEPVFRTVETKAVAGRVHLENGLSAKLSTLSIFWDERVSGDDAEEISTVDKKKEGNLASSPKPPAPPKAPPVQNTAKKAVVAERVDPASRREKPPLDELEVKINAFSERSPNDAQTFMQLVDAQKALLLHYPGHETTLTEYERLKAVLARRVLTSAYDGEEKQTQRQLALYERAYGAAGDTSVERLREKVNKRRDVARLMLKARKQVQERQYIEPEGDNALATYQQALLIESTNEQVLTAKKALVKPLFKRAESALEKQKFALASQYIHAAISADPGAEEPLKLKLIIDKAMARARELKETLARAQRYTDSGYLFLPEEGNAYDAYRRALNIDKNNEQAEKGLESLIDRLSEKVWGLVSEARFEQAQALLSRPLNLMPENKRLQAMSDAVDEVAKR